jgi:type I restriction enzyme S subunit
LSFSLKIERFVSDSAEIWICGLYTISFDEFKEMDFFIPSKLEQQKIASYFCNLDKQISLQTQRLEKLKQIKAACLDKMFV